MNAPARHLEAIPQTVRVADQPLPARDGGYASARRGGTRTLGIVATSLIYALGAALFMVSWTVYRQPPMPKSLSTFDIAPEVAPPAPVSDLPAGPEQVRQERTPPVPEAPQRDLPAPLVAMAKLPVAVVTPAPDPAPPVEEARAPESKPVPPAPATSDARPSWEGRVLAALDKVKRYPREAMFRRQQGVPYIRFTMDRAGRLISVQLERSCGVRALDNEALALPKRAQPLPVPPDDVPGSQLELVVPVEFLVG